MSNKSRGQAFYPAKTQAQHLGVSVGSPDFRSHTLLESNQASSITADGELTLSNDEVQEPAKLKAIEEEVAERDQSTAWSPTPNEDVSSNDFSFEDEDADREDEDLSSYLWDKANKIGLHTV